MQYFDHQFWLLSCGRGKESPKGEPGNFPSWWFPLPGCSTDVEQSCWVTFLLLSHGTAEPCRAEPSFLLPATEPTLPCSQHTAQDLLMSLELGNSLNCLHFQDSVVPPLHRWWHSYLCAGQEKIPKIEQQINQSQGQIPLKDNCIQISWEPLQTPFQLPRVFPSCGFALRNLY